MKLVSAAFACLVLATLATASCSRSQKGLVNLTVSENEEQYKISLQYNPSRTEEVDDLLNDHLRKNDGASFAGATIDAQLTLDDGTHLYMKKHPGYLLIRFNRDDNSAMAYREIKALGKDLQAVLK